MRIDNKSLKQKIFLILHNEGDKDINKNIEEQERSRFVQIKRKYFERGNDMMVMLQIIDISDSFLYD